VSLDELHDDLQQLSLLIAVLPLLVQILDEVCVSQRLFVV
jgi:hypothetical protein